MPRLLIAALALVILLTPNIGCGGSDGPTELDADQGLTVAGFNADVAFTALDGSAYADLLESKDEVIALARMDPDAVYVSPSGERRTMRQVLSDAASALQSSQPDLSAELDRAVETLE